MDGSGVRSTKDLENMVGEGNLYSLDKTSFKMKTLPIVDRHYTPCEKENNPRRDIHEDSCS
jgi:hypothetical protein